MEIKKVVMPGVAPVKPATPQPIVVPVVKPVGVQQVVKPAVMTPQPVVTPQPVQPVQSVTSIPKDERIADIKNAVQHVQTNSRIEQDDDDEEEVKATKPKKKKFTGPRKVIVYGRELFVEENPNVTLEQIREKIVNEYEFPEFGAGRTVMSLDEATGIVVPVISFQKKG